MKAQFLPRPSLLWKMMLSTAVIITVVLAATAWFVEAETASVMTQDLQAVIQAGFQSYASLWKARADNLRSVSMVLSTMSDVRAAFQTNDRATIRDTAAEIWSRVSQSDAFFLVTDPEGRVIASLGGHPIGSDDLAIVRSAARRFPGQVEGFSVQDGKLYEVVITPIYVQTNTAAPGLLNVLVAGFLVDRSVADSLKQRTGGSDFIFRATGAGVISTMPAETTSAIAANDYPESDPRRIEAPSGEYILMRSPLTDLEGLRVGDMLIVRSYDPVRAGIRDLQHRFFAIWGTAILAAAVMSTLIARRILRPIHDLDRAAARIAEQDYSVRVGESGGDEVGRLARTFNEMSASIQESREELIRQERLNTIGRLATSMVHDLRNPLASIYGGAEMLVDGELNEQQTRRVAQNIYRSSRVIKDLLQELADVSRGRMQAPEISPLREIVRAAVASQQGDAEQRKVSITVDIDPAYEVLVEPGRMERVFLNLISNALEAMPDGGSIGIAAESNGREVVVRVADNGPGIPKEIRPRLFQPFASTGRNGLGLGLALSRQAVRAHAGDLFIEDSPGPGARFCVRLPLAQSESVVPERAPDESTSSDEAPRLT